MRVEAAVLEYRGSVWLALIKDKCSSSLVVEFSHIFFTLICIFCVNHFLLEWLVGRSGHEILWRILRAWMMVWELFHVYELRVLHELVSAIWLEAFGRNRPLSGITSQEILSWVLELVAHGIRLKLIKRVGCHRLSSINGKISLLSNYFFCSPSTLIVSTGIANGKWLRQREQSLPWT